MVWLKQVRPWLFAPPVCCAAAVLFFSAGAACAQGQAESARGAMARERIAADIDAARRARAAADAFAGAKEAAEKKAAALAKQQAADEVAAQAASKAAEETKALAAEKAQALKDARARAMADPKAGDALMMAQGDADDAQRAADDAAAALDVKLKELLQVSGDARAAQQDAEAAAALADVKGRAAGALEQKAESEAKQEKSLEDGVLGRKYWDASAAQANKGHLIAVALVDGAGEGGNPRAMRYDRLPSGERVALGGVCYARPAGKAWVESADWGKSGNPVDGAQAAKLDAVAALALGPFEPVAPDLIHGAVVWQSAIDEVNPGAASFYQSREREAPADEERREFVFYKQPGPAGGNLLQAVMEKTNWEGASRHVVINYFYRPKETTPPSTLPPEEKVAAAMRDVRSSLVRVDATFNSGARRIRVSGIVSGNDFDLTVQEAGKVTRQIVAGSDAWASRDGGRTWDKQAPDASYFRQLLALGPGGYDAMALESLWPLYALPGNANDYALSIPGGTASDAVFSLAAGPDGKPVLRGFRTQKQAPASDPPELYVNYEQMPPGRHGVLPPPGNPDAVPGDSANDTLEKAFGAMKSAPVRVELTMRRQEWPKEGAAPVDREVEMHIAGLVSGNDFDLTTDDFGKQGKVSARRIGVGGKVWQESVGSGKKKNAANNVAWKLCEGGDDVVRAPLYAVTEALLPVNARYYYEAAGTEKHGSETWLHIRCATPPIDRAPWREYWIQIGADGAPLGVRRCIDLSASRKAGAVESRDRTEVDYTPAKEGEKIAEPVEARND